ncbi:MAG: hypothetical protein HOO06_09355 [Bdellovibrionaceae bacterium]|jgi:hypothetical protein|nr:hypothetical protein [Pseudobdellovibrionaceae bacterium]
MSRNKFKRGQTVIGEVVEHVEGSRDLIIQLDSKLMRVQNATYRRFAVGDSISLIVSSSSPLRFELSVSAPGQLNLTV